MNSSISTCKISICVPNYNYGRFLENCIESVLAQSYRNWELIIPDDLSTDTTQEICRRYAAQDDRIRFIQNETRLGVYGNLSRVASLAEGEFIKILCADDWLHPRCLESCVDLARNYPSAVLICGNCIDTDANLKPLWSNYILSREFFSGREVLWREIFGYRCVGGNSSFFIRRDAYVAVNGYDPDLKYVGDYLLAMKLCLVGDFAHTNEPLFFGRRHEQQSSAQDPKTLVDVLESFDVLNRFFTFGELKGLVSTRTARLVLLIARARMVAYYWVIVGFRYLTGQSSRAKILRAHLPGLTFPLFIVILAFLPLTLGQACAHKIFLKLRQYTSRLEVIHFSKPAGRC